MSPTPTGRIDHDGGRRTLRLTRSFRAPIEDVWAAVAEPERLERWIGTYTGDPADGKVSFRMMFEEGAPPRRWRSASASHPSDWP
jgi:uncharacterized protein YndB with AHSA1/START domain